MAYIRTPNGMTNTDTGETLPFAPRDNVPSVAPTVGSAILSGAPPSGIAGAPAATSTNPLGAASQPPPVPAVGGGPATTGLPVPPASTTPSATRPAVRGPASGVSPAVDDALIRAKADAQVQQANDQLSPTTMVLNYLQKQGLPRTSENVRRALEANARDSTTIPGLVNQAPPAPTAVDTAPNRGTGVGGGGNRTLPIPPIPPSTAPPATTTTTPTGSAGGLSAADIAALALTAGAGAGGAYGLYRYGNRGGATGDATGGGGGEGRGGGGGGGGGDGGPTPPGSPPPQVEGPKEPLRITDQSTRPALPAPESPPLLTDQSNPLTTSLDRATAPATNAPKQATAADVHQAITEGRLSLPAGTSEQDLADMANRTNSQRLIFGGARDAATAAQARALSDAAAARNAARAGRLFRRP